MLVKPQSNVFVSLVVFYFTFLSNLVCSYWDVRDVESGNVIPENLTLNRAVHSFGGQSLEQASK